MLNRIVKYNLFVGVISLLVSSCYQKNAQNNQVVLTNDDFINDTLIEGIHADSIEFVDTFKLIPVETIHKTIQANVKKKIKHKLPKIKTGADLDKEQLLENIAITHVYATIGKINNDKTLFQQSIKQNEECIVALITDSIEYPQKVSIDSLSNWIEQLFVTNNMNQERAYFEAIIWLENLYLTLENPKNYRNNQKLEELIYMQLDNGVGMLERLSYYQDYQPIGKFSDFLIDIIDCKYFDLDITQLRNEVIETRNSLSVLIP